MGIHSRLKFFRKLAKTERKIDPGQIPENAKKVCKELNDNGFQAYIVGGCVRDLLMGIKPKDWDIATNAKPDQVKSIFPKTFDSGIEHGTITVMMSKSHEDHFEVTTYRVDGNYEDGRRPSSVEYVNDINADLSRRDLTINAIAYDPISNHLADPFGGIEDIDSKIIKAVGNPNDRFSEDGLRTMRAARFAARFGFSMDAETESAISSNLDVLKKVSKERIRDELVKTLATPSPSTGLKILLDTGALSVAIPETLLEKVSSRINDVDSCNGASETKLAVLLCDIDPQLAENALRYLKFSNAEIKKVLFLLTSLREFNSNVTGQNGSIRKFMSFFKNYSPEGPEKSMQEFIEFARAIGLENIQDVASFDPKEVPSKKDLAISGKDIMEKLNLQPGPKIKEIIESIYAKVVEDPSLNEKEKLLELASNFEKLANIVFGKMTKTSSKNFWELSDPEKKTLLNKEIDLGNGVKFRVGDIPELASQVEVPAGPEHHHPEKNQLLHNNMVYDQARKISDDPMVWYGATMHDLGKSFTDKSNWPKQHGHESMGVPHTEKVSEFLGVPDEWKEFASLVAGQHLNAHRAKELKPKTVKKLFELFKNDREAFNKFLEACEADAKGRSGKEQEPYDQKQYLLDMIDSGFESDKKESGDLAGAPLDISPREVMQELNISPGPVVGEVMRHLKSQVEIDPSLNKRNRLIEIAKKHLSM